MANCTAPLLLGFKKWFNDRFLDLCEAHDVAYLTRIWQVKVDSDYLIAGSIMARGYFWLGIGCFFYCMIFGTMLWAWKKWKPL